MTPEGLAWCRADAGLGLYRLYAYRVHAAARRLNACHVNWQDFLSVGRFAAYRYALKVGDGFHPAVGNVVARRAMLTELRNAAGGVGSAKLDGQSRTVPIDDVPEGDPTFTRLDDEPADSGGYSPAVARAMAWLSPRERGVVTMRVLAGMTLDAVGKVYGVTRERVRQIELRGLRKLRDELAPPPPAAVAAAVPRPA